QAHRFEPAALREIGVVYPIVVSARQLDGPVAADDLAEGQTGARVKHRGADADFFEKHFPAFAADVGERALRGEVAIGRVEMVDGRKRAPSPRVGKAFTDVLLRHVLPDRRYVF